jgi:hypothetical protein
MRPRTFRLPRDREVVRAVLGPAEHLDFKTHPRVEEGLGDAIQLYALVRRFEDSM